MVVVTEEDEAAIRAVYRQRGEFAAAIELRRLFPGITDNAQAREWARTIVGWKPLPEPAVHFLAGLEVRHRLVVHLDRQAGGTTAWAILRCSFANSTSLPFRPKCSSMCCMNS